MKGKALRLAIFAGLLGSTASVLSTHAMTETESVTVLNPVVVTAQRFETKDLNTPAAVTVLDQADLKNSGAKSIFDAVGQSTGITTFSYGPFGLEYGAMDSRVNIRGLERSALVLVNGAPINLDGKNSLNGLMMDNVDRIEIVRGAGSAQYGSEALGGVVNVITKSPTQTHATVETRIGNEGYKKYAATVGTDTIEISTSKEYYGAQERTSPDRSDRYYYNMRDKGYAHNVAVNIKPHDYVRVNYMRQQSDSTYGQMSTLTEEIIKNNKKFKGKDPLKESKQYHYRDIKNNASIIYDDATTRAMVFFNNRKLVGESRDLKTLTFNQNDSNYAAYKVGAEAQHTWKLHQGKDTAVLGFMGAHEAYEGISVKNSVVRAHRNVAAVYGSYEFQVTPMFSTTIGGRYQVIDDPAKDQHVFTPQWQTMYKLDDTRSIYTNIGKAFTMPNLHDVYRWATDPKKKMEPQYVKLSGDNLKPEEGWNYEVGYKQVNAKDSWRVSVYHMKFKNFFDWAPNPVDGRNTLRINGGKFLNTGVEVEYKSHITDDLMMTIGGSYSNPRKQQTKSTVWEQSAPKVELNLALDYEKDKWQAGMVASWWGKRLLNRDGQYNPDYINVNAHVNYIPNDSQTIGFYVNNVLNRHNVITHGAYEYWDSPRNYYVNYSYHF